MSFDQPLWLLALIPWFGVALTRRDQGVFFPCARLAQRVSGSWRRRAMRILPVVEILAVSLLIVALAGPRSKLAPVEETVPGVAIQLVIDASSSMQNREGAAGDSRLDTCVRVLTRFLERRVHDRLGIAMFALYPRVVMPLTLDHAAVLERLNTIRTVRSGSAEDNTAIGIALAASAMQLAALTEPAKVIVLVTDGEQRVDDVSLSDAAEFLKARDVRLYAIAAGRTHRGFAADLRAAAERTGGRGYLARDEAALERICSEIDALEKSESTVRRFTPSWPRHREVLLGALAAFVFQLVLGSFALAGTRRLSVAEAHAALETGGSR